MKLVHEGEGCIGWTRTMVPLSLHSRIDLCISYSPDVSLESLVHLSSTLSSFGFIPERQIIAPKMLHAMPPPMLRTHTVPTDQLALLLQLHPSQ